MTINGAISSSANGAFNAAGITTTTASSSYSAIIATSTSSSSSSSFSSTTSTSQPASEAKSSGKPTTVNSSSISSSSATTTSVSYTSSSGIPAGATHTSNCSIFAGPAAGIAIGTALIGALLALIAIWVTMRKRSAHAGGHHRRSHKVTETQKLTMKKNLSELATILSSKEISCNVQMIARSERTCLISMKSSANIARTITISETQGSISTIWNKDLINAAIAALTSPDLLSLNLPACLRSRLTAIRQLIAMAFFARIDWTSSPDTSLLPIQIAAFCQTIAPIEKQPGSEKVFEEAFLRWRHLSAFLIEPFRSNRGTPKLSKEEVRAAIERNVALLNSILKPFIKPGDGNVQYQEENLAAIAFEIAQFGLLIFSQPSDWVFEWPKEVAHTFDVNEGSVPRKSVGRDLAVFPGIGEIIERGDERHLRAVAHPVLVKI